MPETTARLALPVPLNSDPANVPAYMLGLANALDGGANVDYDGAAVIISTPGGIGALPASPVIGTIYPVSGSPPYLLYYTGESTPGTGTAPTGWRLVGQAGTNVAYISNTSPGNSASPGIQPVWAPLDHRHASLPWSAGQTSSFISGLAGSDGSVQAYARADHAHGPAGLLSGMTAAFDSYLPGVTITESYSPLPSPGCSVTLNTGSLVLVSISATIFLDSGTSGASGAVGFSVSGNTTISAPVNPNVSLGLFDGPNMLLESGLGATWPVALTPGINTFTIEVVGSLIGGASANATNIFLTILPVA